MGLITEVAKVAVTQLGRYDGQPLKLAWSRMDMDENGPFTAQVH